MKPSFLYKLTSDYKKFKTNTVFYYRPEAIHQVFCGPWAKTGVFTSLDMVMCGNKGFLFFAKLMSSDRRKHIACGRTFECWPSGLHYLFQVSHNQAARTRINLICPPKRRNGCKRGTRIYIWKAKRYKTVDTSDL